MIEITSVLETERYLDDLDAVVFDLDDTLYPEIAYVRSGYEKIAELYPQIPAMASELWESFCRKEQAVDTVLERHGLLSEKDKAMHAYRFQQPRIVLFDGVADMLERMAHRVKIGIITDGRPEGQHAKLKALGLEELPCIITDELGSIEFRKPNPAAFTQMAQMLSCEPGRMAYVGDNIRKDFQAPEALGMRCIYFKNHQGLYA